MGDWLTIREVAELTKLHYNTISHYIKSDQLPGKKVSEGPGKEQWLVDREILYATEIPTIRDALDPKTVRQFKTSTERARDAEKQLGELKLLLEEKEREIAGLAEEKESMQATIKKGEQAFVNEKVTDAQDWGNAALGVMYSAMQKTPSAREVDRLLEEKNASLAYKLVEDPADEEIYWEVQYKLTGEKDVWKAAEPLRFPKLIPESKVAELAEDGARNVEVVSVGKEWELRRELPKKSVWATPEVKVSADLWPMPGASGLNRYLLRKASGSRQPSAERLRARQILYVRRLWWILAAASLLVVAPLLIARLLPVNVGVGPVVAGAAVVVLVKCTYQMRVTRLKEKASKSPPA
ncbi:MAG: helix-turn-helix domain-containing protein [Chloroflexi bacterium]|nr:helix-turn-helix domain-containing protein [Chloroflexota bacterium]